MKMKRYRFLYWFGSCYTDCYIVAESEEKAKARFNEIKGSVDGNKHIIRIEEVEG